MADDDGEPKKAAFLRNKETYQRAPETSNEQRFPHYRVPGIVDVPVGSRGPRSLYLRRNGDTFGFTLRHFIIYPPESVADTDGRHAAVGAMLTPMDTIFVKHVAQGGPAEQAGLQRGDRILYVNGESVSVLTYVQVVGKIQTSPPYLHLLVVPKEEDVLQKYFSDTAHNPASNQAHFFDDADQRRRGFQVDSVSWRSLQGAGPTYGRLAHRRPQTAQQQKSADNIYSSVNDFTPYQRPVYQKSADNLYSTSGGDGVRGISINDAQRARAQPQVPLYRKMGRRSSDCATSEHLNCDEVGAMKGANYGVDMTFAATTNTPATNCRMMAMEPAGRRRESSSSLGSSATNDGSKDSLLSYDSTTSTLTGHDTDDSVAMLRLKKSLQKKEEFLRRPSNSGAEQTRIQKEFYSRAKKLDKPVWPPHDSPTRHVAKPTHHVFQRVKNDIESERECAAAPNQPQHQDACGGTTTTTTTAKTSKDWHFGGAQLGQIHEAPPTQLVNGSGDADDRRSYPPHSHHQIVSKRAKQFEAGQVTPEDDPLAAAAAAARTEMHRSELARMAAQKRVVPNVAVRTKEFETLMYEPRREFSASSIASSASAQLRKSFRDSRSLDSSGSNCSLGSSIAENVKQLPGNFSIPIGSKFIHCLPPSESQATKDIPNDVQLVKTRARSNSAGSWAQAMQESKSDEQMDTSLISARAPSPPQPLIPQPVERMRPSPPCVSITPASPVPNGTHPQKPTPSSPPHVSMSRPTELDLAAPKRPMRHLRPPHVNAPPVPPADKHLVVRRTKNTNLTDEERGTRRESYLKATEGGRMHFESADLSDGDLSPQLLRSAHKKWRPYAFPGDIQQLCKLFEDTASSQGGSLSGGSSSSTSLEREKLVVVEKEKPQFVRERQLHLKITEIDGKRYPDRSWKQVWAVLKGPKLFLYKDRHHLSPVGTSEVADQSLASGVDMRGSCVQVADDYTKRKNVLRISSVLPCRSELLLQAESTDELVEWVQVLQEQVAVDVDGKDANSGKQQAVPQAVPSGNSVQASGNKSKLPTLRNRSPTGQSPVSKTRKPSSQVNDPSTSPKSKTWRGRVAKQFRRMQPGGSSPSSPTAPDGSTFGNNLDNCLPSADNPYVPRLVEVCTDIVENRGLEMIGIYRVPGNNAAVTALTDEVNKSHEEVTQTDPRWADVHVVSSLLKSFFRKMPDSLLTTSAYPYFIQADNIDSPVTRLEEIRKLIKNLPIHHYNTLRHLILHLRRVADNSDANKMDTKNLAIVFGPTIVRTGEENMQKMVNDMTHQCKIVESLLKYADWFFSEDSVETLNLPAAPIAQVEMFATEMETNAALLKDNISKMEGLTQSKEKDKQFIQSLFSAAQKVYRKKPKDKDEPQSPTGTGQFPIVQFANATNDLKESTTDVKENTQELSKEAQGSKPRDFNAVFNYKKDNEMFRQRVENFIQETQSNLSRPRKSESNSNNSLDMPNHQMSSSSSSNVRHSLTVNNTCDQRVITKTNSASNVFGRTTLSTEKCTLSNPQFLSFVAKPDKLNNSVNKLKDSSSDVSSNASDYKLQMRRGSSVENIGNQDFVNANGKKIKYENENESSMQRTNSLDSLNKLPALDDGDLVTTMTKIYDERKKKLNPSILSDENIPYVDESPEKICRQSVSYLNKENIPSSPKLYRNPSLHKSQYTSSKLLAVNPNSFKLKEKLEVAEKDEDSTLLCMHMPDNDKIALTTSKMVNIMTGNSKLRRSESLNKPDRTVSPLNNKLKRSESLNKANDRLKRSDSLTKNEKTESNISKKREISSGVRRGKDVFKLKRKNGMPDRSIKRRHTVGGYPDKIILDNRAREEVAENECCKKEKSLRTSSPDLSSTRRERLFLEVNFIGSENMILALRQQLVGARPQSFPESVYKVPLESHV